MVNLNEVDANLRKLPSLIDKMTYATIYDILYSVPDTEIPIQANSLLGALSLADFALKDEYIKLDEQEKAIIHERITVLTGGLVHG